MLRSLLPGYLSTLGPAALTSLGEGQMAASLLQDLIHVAWKILARANLASDRPDLDRAGVALPWATSRLCMTSLRASSLPVSYCPEDLP